MDFDQILLVFSLLLIIAVFTSKISVQLGVPALLLFIFVGILAGTDGIGGIHFDNFLIAQQIGIVALIYILFMGGLSFNTEGAAPTIKKGLLLATVGILITATITGLLCHLFLDFSLLECLLLGAIVSSTDAAAVFSVLRARNIHLKGHLKELLEFESGSNDPMAVFLTGGIIALITLKLSSPASLGLMFIREMGLGILLGFLIAKIGVLIVNKIKLEYKGLYIALTIAFVAFAYSFTTMLHGNGFMSVYVCGLTMASANFIYKKTLTRFHDGIAWIMQIVVFLTLGLLFFIKESAELIVPALFITLILILVARPAAVFISMAFAKISVHEKLFISWVGLRGAAPIVLATFPLSAGIEHSHAIFDIVFFLVIISVAIQGTTVPLAAKILKVDADLEKNVKAHS